MATTHNAHSDLIHLFIDGEATETERNLLFGALKDSPELQEEFSSAMQLKQAFATDISKLQPPSYLESKIAERAGLLVAASSSLATAPVVVNSLSNSITSALSNVAPVAATGISKGLMTLLIGTTVGVLSTIGIIEYSKTSSKVEEHSAPIVENRSSSVPPVQNESLPAQPAPVEMTPQASNADVATHAANTANLSHSSVPVHTLPALRFAANVPDLHFSKATLNKQHNIVNAAHETENSVPKNIVSKNTDAAENTIPATPAAVNDINSNSNNIPATESIAEIPAMRSINTTDPIIPVTKNVGYNAPGHNPLFNGSEGYFNEPDWMARLSIGLRYTGIGSGTFYQAHDDIAAPPSWNEMGLAVKYELSPFNAIAIEAGQETFPVYLIRNGTITDHHSIAWIGGSYTQSFPLFQLFGIHPEVRGLLAGSTAGPIGKISAGLAWRATDNFGFSIAPEATALFIKENGAITAGGKLGLSASIILHF
jgi:hypothetical protein